ncbi:MAG: hypothetical protein OXC07_04830, partial [Kistimonas sp.]|nr:hypothetical protein [Kistimonas sp.]
SPPSGGSNASTTPTNCSSAAALCRLGADNCLEGQESEGCSSEARAGPVYQDDKAYRSGCAGVMDAGLKRGCPSASAWSNVASVLRHGPFCEVSSMQSGGEASENSALACRHPNRVCHWPGEVVRSLVPAGNVWLLVTSRALSADPESRYALLRVLRLSHPQVSHSGPLSDPAEKVGQMHVDADVSQAKNLQTLMASNGTLHHVWSSAADDASEKLHWLRFTEGGDVQKGNSPLPGEELLLVSDESNGVNVWIRHNNGTVERRLLEDVGTPAAAFKPDADEGPVVALARHDDWVYSLNDNTDQHWQLRRWNITTGARDPSWSKAISKMAVSPDEADPECLFLSEHTSAGASGSRVLPNAMGFYGNLDTRPEIPDQPAESCSSIIEMEFSPNCSCATNTGWKELAATGDNVSECHLPPECKSIDDLYSCGSDQSQRNVEVMPSLAESNPRLIISDCRVYLVPQGSLPYKHSDGPGSTALAPLLPREGGCLEWCERPLRFEYLPECLPEKMSIPAAADALSPDPAAAASLLLLIPGAAVAVAAGCGVYKCRHKCRKLMSRNPDHHQAAGGSGRGEGESVSMGVLTWLEGEGEGERRSGGGVGGLCSGSGASYVEPDSTEQGAAVCTLDAFGTRGAALHPDQEARLAAQLAGLAVREGSGSANLYVESDNASSDTLFLSVPGGARRSLSRNHSDGGSSQASAPRLISAGD